MAGLELEAPEKTQALTTRSILNKPNANNKLSRMLNSNLIGPIKLQASKVEGKETHCSPY